ncbi:immunoglobulin domain-containing protein, partial [Flavobacterium sp. ZB4P13]|uniref:immunoglobulin domain-containing protein n=1 Tax=Flavobacterium sp. ZB4P13 TaxID=3401728 RepID=UPI003AB060AA
MKKITFLKFVTSLILVFTTIIFDLDNIYAQQSTDVVNGDACISITNCPPDQFKCANTIVNGQSGANFTWTTPTISQTCSVGSNPNANFQMLFELNESLLSSECWDFNYISRVGGNGGHIKLFSGSDGDGSKDSKITTPYLIIEDDTNVSIDARYSDGTYSVQLVLVGDATHPDIPLSVQSVTSSTSTYSWAADFDAGIGTTTHTTGVYRLKFIFHYTGSEPKNANKGDTVIAVKAILNDDGCSAGIDFSVTGPNTGFYPIGSHNLQYVATYTSPSGVVKTKTCSFNITVGSLPTVTGTTPSAHCGTGSVTLGATASAGTINWYTDAIGGSPLATGNSYTTPSITSTTTYYVDATNNSCTSARTAVTATITPLPTATITGILTACLTTTLTANTNAVSPSYVWYKNDVIISGQTASTLVVTANGDYKVKITNGVTSCEQTSASSTVSVEDTVAPVVNATNSSSTVSCISAATAPTPPNATDNCSGTINGVLFSTTDTPNPLTCEGTREYKYKYTDSSGNFSYWTYTYTIEREPFTTIAPAGSIVACVASAVTSTIQLPTVTDNCGNTLSPTPASPVTGGTYDGCEGTKTFTYTYTDCEGNFQDFVYTYTIEREPFTTIAPAGSTVACVASAVTSTIQLPTVTDNCGSTLSPTPASPATGGTYDGCEGTKTFTYTYTDCEGNSQDFVYTYTIEREPFTTIAPAGSTVACVASAVTSTIQLPTVTDNCGNTLSPTPASPATGGTYDGCEGTKTFTYTYTDCEGNSQDFVYTYTIEREPFTTIEPAGSTVACVASAVASTIQLPTVTDNCGNSLSPTPASPAT